MGDILRRHILFVAAKLLHVYETNSIIKMRHALRRSSLSLVCAFAMLIMIATATKTAESYSDYGSSHGRRRVSRLSWRDVMFSHAGFSANWW